MSLRSRTILVPVMATACVILACGTLAQDASNAPDVPAREPVGDEAYQILAEIYEYDRSIPLQARVVHTERLPECAREKIVFRVRDSWVVGYLGLPKTGAPPFPCVLGLHGIGASKTSWWEDDNFAHGGNLTKSLLAAGIAVFTPDAQYHGERAHENDYRSPSAMLFEMGWIKRIRDMVVQSVIDCRRAIDYLEKREDIDGARIGVIGYSLGGIQAFSLTGLDRRVKTAVSCVASISNIDEVGGGPSLTPRNFVRGLEGRPFLMLMGRKDPACTVESAQRVYDRIPGNAKEVVVYDSGHRLPIEYVTKASEWIQEYLK